MSWGGKEYEQGRWQVAGKAGGGKGRLTQVEKRHHVSTCFKNLGVARGKKKRGRPKQGDTGEAGTRPQHNTAHPNTNTGRTGNDAGQIGRASRLGDSAVGNGMQVGEAPSSAGARAYQRKPDGARARTQSVYHTA